ncbi:hypothetical protein BIFADO_01870, partial [Bifidobacterium adolescentis L2-32]
MDCIFFCIQTRDAMSGRLSKFETVSRRVSSPALAFAGDSKFFGELAQALPQLRLCAAQPVERVSRSAGRTDRGLGIRLRTHLRKQHGAL